MYKFFNKIDYQQKGYLELDDFMKYFAEIDQDFVELPYLERLFNIIDKSKGNQIFFEEFVGGVSVFCLLNS